MYESKGRKNFTNIIPKTVDEKECCENKKLICFGLKYFLL